MREFFFENKATNIYCYAWEDVVNPRGVVQLAHDCGDYCARYDAFARFLNANGFIVVGEDHRGHGKTCGGFDHRGEVYGDCFNDTVDDIIKLSALAISFYRLPLVLIGFGYGSVLAQNYLSKNGGMLSGAVLMGTAFMRSFPVFLGGIVAGTQIGFIDPLSPSYVVSNAAYKLRSRRFLSEKTRYAFLSRDKNVVRQYVTDTFCGAQFVMSLAFHKSYLNTSFWMYTKRRYNAIPSQLPILLMGGGDDPIGSYGASVDKLYKKLVKHGCRNVFVNIYNKARHELLFETNKTEVYSDVYVFLQKCFEK